MPVRRRYFRKRTTYRRKASKPYKRRMAKMVAKRKAYSYDGIVKHKFVVESTFSANAAGTCDGAFVGHHINRDVGGTLTLMDAVDWAARAAFYNQFRYKGVKIEYYPVPTDNQTNNRTIRAVHIASWPYEALDQLQANLGNNQVYGNMLQRKDYKVYPGKVFRIKRYYKLPKTLNGLDIPEKEPIGKGGWMPVTPEANTIVRYGGTLIKPDAVNWTLNDNLGRVVVTYYVEFKE